MIIIINPWTVGLVASAVASVSASVAKGTAKKKMREKQEETKKAREEAEEARAEARRKSEELARLKRQQRVRRQAEEVERILEQERMAEAAEQKAKEFEAVQQHKESEALMLEFMRLLFGDCDDCTGEQARKRLETYCQLQLSMAQADGQICQEERETTEQAVAEFETHDRAMAERLSALLSTLPTEEDALQAVRERVAEGDDAKCYLDALICAMKADQEISIDEVDFVRRFMHEFGQTSANLPYRCQRSEFLNPEEGTALVELFLPDPCDDCSEYISWINGVHFNEYAPLPGIKSRDFGESVDVRTFERLDNCDACNNATFVRVRFCGPAEHFEHLKQALQKYRCRCRYELERCPCRLKAGRELG